MLTPVKWTVRQAEGSIAFAAIAAIVYAAFSLSSFIHPSESLLPWIDERCGTIIAEIAGLSDRAGIYFLPKGTKVVDLLRAASESDLSRFPQESLATNLGSGAKITIESNASLRIEEMAAAKRILFDLPIDINKAAMDELMMVPGIGEKRALQILELRQSIGRFKRIDELTRINGIKERKLSQLKKYLYVEEN